MLSSYSIQNLRELTLIRFNFWGIDLQTKKDSWGTLNTYILYYLIAFSTEIEFYKARADKKFLYDDTDQRIATGLSTEEFEYLLTYLERFRHHFVKVTTAEALNLLMTYIRFVL